jgi:hypothetical protein
MRKTMRELKQEARYEALAEMRERVADGSLLIRQMTAEERARHAPRPRATPSHQARAGTREINPPG